MAKSKESADRKPGGAYQRSLFTYLDILGFRQLVDGSPPEKIKNLLEILGSTARPDERLLDAREMSFLTFSDCTVRSVHIDSDSNKKFPDGILFYELMNLVHTQARLIFEGYLMRGGMTIGNIFIDGTMVFGPAMVRAYTLESEFAVFPRIVIDPNVFELFESDHLMRNEIHDLTTERAYIRKLVRRDSDGLYFIDYLGGIIDEFDEPGGEYAFFEDHKKLILKGTGKQAGFNKIAAKYLWLATYHNAVMDELGPKRFEQDAATIDHYRISKDEMPMLYDINDFDVDEENESYE